MVLHVRFETLIEDQPGPNWQAHFERLWPGYRSWYLRGDAPSRPSYLDCRRALRRHLPELVPVWERLCDLAGGGDLESRFLSLWCPPPYIAGCSQGVWIDPKGHEEPALLRNYDYAPALLEGRWLATRWCGQRVAALSDCLWGVLDGLNEAGLVASLSFGGRTQIGEGFGIPVLLRYVLEVARSTSHAIELLARLPVNMTYSVTLLDAEGDWATVFMAPDRATEVTRQRAVTNFQRQVEWPEHADATHAVLRLAALNESILSGCGSAELCAALLRPPLFQPYHQRGYGTLYTAMYRPASGRIGLMWPGQDWTQELGAFSTGAREVIYASE